MTILVTRGKRTVRGLIRVAGLTQAAAWRYHQDIPQAAEYVLRRRTPNKKTQHRPAREIPYLVLPLG